MMVTLSELNSSRGSDNFSVPIIAALSYDLYLINYTHGHLINLLVWSLFSGIVFFLAYRLKSLNKNGVITAYTMGIIIFGAGGLQWATPIVTFFILSSIISKISSSDNLLNKGSKRDIIQVMANGGDVLGVTTKHLDQYEVGHTGVTELKIADDMHARKNMMFEEADGFIIMPGGFGTLEELFEVITWKQIGLHDKPIVVVNVDGFWDPLKNLMDTIIKKKFASATDDAIVCFVDKVEDAVSTLVDAPRVSINPSKKWVRE